jgi:cytochrome c553
MIEPRMLMAALLAAATGLAQADVTLGKTKARACAVCHGALGVAVAPDTPNLAGQPERYLSEQLKAYRSGKRSHEVMSVMAKPLTDDDIGDLAAWFASLTIEVKTPP